MASVAAMRERSEVAARPARHDRRRLGLSLLIVGVIALAVAWLGDPRTASFSDAGARLATVKTMAANNTWEPDLGYWAGSVDPGATNHPILFATPHGDAWVAVNGLPLVVAGRPLWEMGGARLAVLIPVLSVVLAAYAARRLSRWASGGDGWLALWFVGLLSPVLFYGADFWEHAPAVGLALLGTALVLEGGARRCVVGGLLAGLAVALRNDALVTFFALGVAVLVVAEERERCRTRWRELSAGAAAFVGLLSANWLIEKAALAGGTGASRAGGRAEVAGSEIAQRLRDAVITSVGVFANEYWLALMIGGVIGIGILLMAAAAADTSGSTTISGVVGATFACLGMAWRLVAFGISTVPGFLTAAPVAALGLFGTRTRREQVLWGAALAAIPLIWLTQWVGDHSPQWGARYLLFPTSLLVVLAAGQVVRLGRRPMVVALLGLAAVMSLVGCAWHIQRTRDVATFADAVMDVPEEVVVVGDTPYWGSEIGSWYGDRNALTARTIDGYADARQMAEAIEVARKTGADRLDVMDSRDDALERIDEAPRYAGFTFESARVVQFLWDDVVIRRYRAS